MKKKRGSQQIQEIKRVLVVNYLSNHKGTHQQAAEVYQLSKSAVDKIWTRYKNYGNVGLNSKKRGTPQRQKFRRSDRDVNSCLIFENMEDN